MYYFFKINTIRKILFSSFILIFENNFYFIYLYKMKFRNYNLERHMNERRKLKDKLEELKNDEEERFYKFLKI